MSNEVFEDFQAINSPCGGGVVMVGFWSGVEGLDSCCRGCGLVWLAKRVPLSYMGICTKGPCGEVKFRNLAKLALDVAWVVCNSRPLRRRDPITLCIAPRLWPSGLSSVFYSFRRRTI
ncbi:hypothetical protein Tco_0654843 [Tanacetum coccineum]|uniref:Uncharacterized protein n=1 Tax=Tanacetum coccineum TaxID=301880 RepID=A0ABQ4X4F7_9ASTR